MTKEEILSNITGYNPQELQNRQTEPILQPHDCLQAMEEYAAQAIAEHEADRKVIKAKALRKKGTDMYYQYDFEDGFFEAGLPNAWEETDLLISGFADLPSDAELIDIEIIVKKGGEG